MPSYDYDCTAEACAHKWEVEAKITAEKETVCPKCKAETARRLVSKPMFELRGTGWFRDGY